MAAIIVAEFEATGSAFTGRFQTFEAGKMSHAARLGGGCGVGVGPGFGVGFGVGLGVGASVGRGVGTGVGCGVGPGVGAAAATLGIAVAAASGAVAEGTADDGSEVAAASGDTLAAAPMATPASVRPGVADGSGSPLAFSRIATVITPASAKKTSATRVPRSDMPAAYAAGTLEASGPIVRPG
jgi:hypothetical protein